MSQKGNGLNCFSQAHLISQNAVDALVVEVGQPVHPLKTNNQTLVPGGNTIHCLTRFNSGLPIYFSSPQLCARSIPKTEQYHNTRIKIKTCKTATDKKKKKWQMEHNVGKTVSFFHNQNLHSIFVVVLTYLLLHTKYILSHTTHPPCVFYSLNCGRKLF